MTSSPVIVFADELSRMVVEILLGYQFGDPRSLIPNTPLHRKAWDQIVLEVTAIRSRGNIVEVEPEIPDSSVLP